VPPLDPHKQRAFAVDVVRTLRARQYEAYWAGGCVRDQLLGKPPKDYDVATTATPEQIREVFGKRRTVPVGAAFGVMTIIGPKEAGDIEVATFRQDAAYSDGRHPDSVQFSTPEADAQRRDFTINGLFYDPLEDRVIDFVGGQDDLARGILRAIGDPAARFAEDKLRMLRAVRFAATLDLTLDLPTRNALEEMVQQITVVSVERIAAEIRAMLLHPARARAIDLLREVGLLDVVLPELAIANQPGALTAMGRAADEAWVTTLSTLDSLGASDFAVGLAALMAAFVSPEGAWEVCRRWKLANRDGKRVVWLLENHHALEGARHLSWPKLQRLLVSEEIEDLLILASATLLATGRPTDEVDYCRQLLQMPPEELNPAPLMTGDDLIRHGVAPGQRFQYLLSAVRDAQLEKRIATLPEALALVDQLLHSGDDTAPATAV